MARTAIIHRLGDAISRREYDIQLRQQLNFVSPEFIFYATSALEHFFTNKCMPPEYLPHIDLNHTLIKSDYGQGDYLDQVFTSQIEHKKIKTVLEIGSRDAIDAQEISDFYQTHVYAFECNPEAIQICEHNINANPNVTMIPLACWNTSGEIPFYPVTGSREHQQPVNIGASSCLKINPDGIDNYSIQSKSTVSAIRLEDWMAHEGLDHIDLLCLDVQGATLQVLSGLGRYLYTTKYIITEGYHQPGYFDETLAPGITDYLLKHGFKYKGGVGDALISNALFINSAI